MKLRVWLGAAYVLGACGTSTTEPTVDLVAGAAGTTQVTADPSGGHAGNPTAGAGTPPSAAGTPQNRGGNGTAEPPLSGGATSSGAVSGAGASGGAGGMAPDAPRRVLLYHFSTLAIDTVPEQLTLLSQALKGWGYESEESVDPQDLSEENLARFGAVAMINTCFEPFGAGQAGTAQTAALSSFVEQGGALFGTHCASVTFQSAEPPHAYNELLGGRGGDGYFDGESACQTLEIHPTTTMLPGTFSYRGNLDNADYLAMDSTVLVRCRWSGGAKKDVPVSWFRTLGRGRIFYTNFAKTSADLKDETIGAGHVLAGLRWALTG